MQNSDISRAINVDAAAEAVTEICQRLGVAVSAMEPLLCGGTRVVCCSSVGAHALRKQLGDKVLQRKVSRIPLAPRHSY